MKRVCEICGREGTTGIKLVDGRYLCRKRKQCVMRATAIAFADKPKPPAPGDFVYLGTVMEGVKLWGVQSDPNDPATMTGTLVADNDQGTVRTLQGQVSMTIPFKDVQVNPAVLQAILGPGEKI